MVWEMMYNPQYKLSTEEVEGSWTAVVDPAAAAAAEQQEVSIGSSVAV
jgi:hypothetical protein